ncbi:hypothetical protein [Ciceribacter sp. RN22]|uniref:hypothetical protein n=1 Tax=Ciceribacter sp. RN22 TaxID=2954932 RepID=UPI002092A0CE|nr:hypothetical protein [Ciceribacter sp. RN22]MCO6177288.1 hypothetical protein [Ciceribacter sp. RN22]
MKTYTAVFAALLAVSTSSLLSAPAMATEKCSTVAQCLGHDSSSSARGDQSNDDNGTAGDTDRNRERNERNGNDDNGRGESDNGAGHDSGHDGGSDHNGGSDNDD